MEVLLFLEVMIAISLIAILYVISKKDKERIIITSGYFDPLHEGHVECFKLSKEIGGKLIVILNNDNQCIMKKGKFFMNEKGRAEILRAIRYIDGVFLSIDKDKNQCESIKALAERYKGYEIIFTKGGDRLASEIPEAKTCRELGIKIIDGLGKKIQSSSNLTGLKEIK
jgi:cytidyltransferase-like protein